MKALQQVSLSPVLFEKLALIDTITVFQYQVQIAKQHISQRRGVLVCLQLLSHLGHQLRDTEPFVGFHAQRTIKEIREELIAVYLAFQFSAVQQFRRPQQYPTTQRDTLAIVFQSAYLSWFYSYDGGIAYLQRLHTVRERIGKLPLDEQPIHAIVVQAMTEGRQLVVMDDAN